MTSKPQLAQLPAQADMHTAGVCLFARLRGCVQMSLLRVPMEHGGSSDTGAARA